MGPPRFRCAHTCVSATATKAPDHLTHLFTPVPLPRPKSQPNALSVFFASFILPVLLFNQQTILDLAWRGDRRSGHWGDPPGGELLAVVWWWSASNGGGGGGLTGGGPDRCPALGSLVSPRRRGEVPAEVSKLYGDAAHLLGHVLHHLQL
ncbi:hypothetical protein BRADI_1g39671v3 [Brachypodium distachyon]|uniref:Uncharacterized protein n=1 Tax=Brachypodium distachyon TaxID=15368 RepID=A0A2K2DNL4_BRADI|nr:hypothetical protein BRADI_1g39671v3 [Brachypodium distachyon]